MPSEISGSSSFCLVVEIFCGVDLPVEQDMEVRDDQADKENQAAKHIQGVLYHLCPPRFLDYWPLLQNHLLDCELNLDQS